MDIANSEMPRLKSILGKGPRFVDKAPLNTSEPNREYGPIREGFAMRPKTGPCPPTPRAGYEGPKPYGRGSLENARQLASCSADACAIACELEADAPSSRGPLMSRIATWSDLAIRAGYAKPFHLEPGVIYAVIGVLKAAGYRSAVNYLDAAKRVHIEQGRPWTSQLQQAYRKAKRSAERDLGASKQAQPLDFELMAKVPLDLAAAERSPARPGKSALIASWWLLREIEASNAKWGHVTIDVQHQRVHWVLPNSKADPAALGATRSHSCSCQSASAALCPFHLLSQQVDFAQHMSQNAQGWLFPCKDGSKPTKAGWAMAFKAIATANGICTVQLNGAEKFTGHTARVSGAQHLAKANIELWRIQLFGRWSSEAFLKYIRDAPLENLHSLASESSLQQSLMAAKSELQRLGRDITDMKNQVGAQVQATQEMFDEVEPLNHGIEANDPCFVENLASGGKVHKILACGDKLHPRHWRTVCNWHFGRGLTAYNTAHSVPTGTKCRRCFRSKIESNTSDSDSSSSIIT